MNFPNNSPPCCDVDHKWSSVGCDTTFYKKKLQKFKNQINELMEQCYIQLNELFHGAIILFMDIKKMVSCACA
jgi:hypothetical protein